MAVFAAFANALRFSGLARDRRRMVFYSEGPADWPHLGPLVQVLVEEHRQPITYLASHPEDPGLQLKSDLVSGLEIGLGSARTILFRTMEADVVVMTMPDLDVFHLKRSRHPVHYVYVFHAFNSAHMIYPRHSFDAYDTILCAGGHHCRELRELERLNKLQRRNLVEYGHGRIDDLMAAQQRSTAHLAPSERIRVLLAPTWGPSSILEQCGQELLAALLHAGLNVTFRPHPMSCLQSSAKLDMILTEFSPHPLFTLDTGVSSNETLLASDVLITDWSGIAFEFAFALLKPVLFVDVPPKIRNPTFEDVPMPPIEMTLRTEVGEVLPLNRIDSAGDVVKSLTGAASAWRSRLEALRSRYLFNVGECARVGASALMELLPSR
jgi:YidC/Oxa1 family membrane protein insertase